MSKYEIIKYCDFIVKDSIETTKGIIVAVRGILFNNYPYLQFVHNNEKYNLFALSNDNNLINFNKPEDLSFENFKLKYSFTICPHDNYNICKKNVAKCFESLVKHWFEHNDLDFSDDLKVDLYNVKILRNKNSFKEINL